MPHQLYISTLPTFTYKEYVDGHRIQYVKKKEWENMNLNIFVWTFKAFHRWNLRTIEKINFVEKLYTKTIIRGFIIKNEKQEHNYWLYIFKKRYNKKSRI